MNSTIPRYIINKFFDYYQKRQDHKKKDSKIKNGFFITRSKVRKITLYNVLSLRRFYGIIPLDNVSYEDNRKYESQILFCAFFHNGFLIFEI